MTKARLQIPTFVRLPPRMERIKTIALTHRNLELADIGLFHFEDETLMQRVAKLRESRMVEELMYLSTCNRVEFIFTSNMPLDATHCRAYLEKLAPDLESRKLDILSKSAELHSGDDAIEHVFRVASSLDSMVVGEREIITQVRQAFERSKALGLTGDWLRLLTRLTIESAKRIYTETDIARRPVSVVSLAYRHLREKDLPLDARIILVGAGKTNTDKARFLKKHGFSNFFVYNRSLENAKILANELGGIARPLSTIKAHREGADVLIACTGSTEPVVTEEVFQALTGGPKNKVTTIDLAVPHDITDAVVALPNVDHLSIEDLRATAVENLKARERELVHCESILSEELDRFNAIFAERTVERAMRQVPREVKAIKALALEQVFAKDLDGLDPEAREVLDKVVAFMEKKYISGPMKLAKDLIIKGRADRLN